MAVPAFDIPGNPGAIRSKAGELRTHGTVFESVAEGLDAISTDGWVSLAADRFREKFSPEAGRWRDAGRGFRGASDALTAYAAALESAQASAQWARDEYARGDEVTRSARAAYDADVRRGQREKAEAEAAGIAFTLTILPFVDPGEAIRDGARAAYETAVSQLRSAGQTAAAGVRAGCAGAPESRSWWETGLAFVGDIMVGLVEAVEGLAKLAMLPQTMLQGFLDDIAALATGRLTPEELAMKHQLRGEDALAFARAVWEDPGAVGIAIGKGILDWDTWADDPGKAIGHLIPDLILTIATLGAGSGAVAAERGALGALRGAENLEDVASAVSRLDDLPDLTRIYRVEGPGNARIVIDGAGNVAIKGDSALFLNLGDQARAVQFLEQRLGQGFSDTVIKHFDVLRSWADDIAARAVPESMAKGSTVFQVDVTKTAASYGLRAEEFEALLRAIVPRSGGLGL